MKHLFFVSILFVLFISKVNSQDLKSEIYDPPLVYHGNTDWATDYVVSATEPLGKESGVYRLNNTTLYVAVPDSNIVAGKCLVVLSSTNNGASWSTAGSVSPAGVVPKSKMVIKDDSVYCLFIFGSTLYCWNIISNNFNPYTGYTTIRDFDVTISSTKSIYIIVDLNTNNDIRLASTINGGVSWAGAIFLSSAGALPKIYMSGTGDTCLLNYYGPPVAGDTLTSAIRNVRYRESVPGSLLVVGSFTSPIAAGTTHDQFEGVIHGGKAWIFYTSGLTGNIDMNCIQSNDNGTTYGAPVTIGALPSRDEYWFSAKHYASGVDLIFYSDSLQSGPPTNNSDKIFYTSAPLATPTGFNTPVQVSQFPPTWSTKGYIPTLIEYYDATNDAGAVWVGNDGSNKKLYFDRYGALTGAHNNQNGVPAVYSLSQNYPNPFNPVTTIMYSIPKSSLVTLKLYDVTGRLVKTLVNDIKQAGIQEIKFDASNLASGVYFYRMDSGDFTDVKKMVLIK